MSFRLKLALDPIIPPDGNYRNICFENALRRFLQSSKTFNQLADGGCKKVIPNMEEACVQSILRFDVILQHDWSIKQCLLHIRVFFGGKTKRPCFDLFIHWLIKQITLTETIFQGHTKIPLSPKLCLFYNFNYEPLTPFLVNSKSRAALKKSK